MKPIQPLAGISGLEALLESMTTPKKLKELLGYIKSLEEARKSLNESIELVGKAREISSLLTAARADRAQATRDLDAAKLEADGSPVDNTWESLTAMDFHYCGYARDTCNFSA